MEELWYKKPVTFEDAVGLVQKNLGSMVDSFIAAGYWLKRIRDSQEYEEYGYQTIWACAWMEFGLAKSEASRAMSMNDKYSVDGDSPYISDKYKQYSKSQLQEMLKMSEQQIEQVSPDMTVREIREIKHAELGLSEEDHSRKLEDFIQCFTSEEYVGLRRIYNEHAGFSMNDLTEWRREIEITELGMYMILEDDMCLLVDHETGEILEQYAPNQVIRILSEAFSKKLEEKQKKVRPDIKGFMENPYCMICGAPLIPPGDTDMSESCGRCGQAIDWSEWEDDIPESESESVGASQEQVNTRSDEEFEMEIMEEIEEDPDQEELSVDFNTDELLKKLDNIIDADFREVEDPEEKSTAEGLSAYGLPKTEYPPDSLLAEKGCGHRYVCFSCAQECGIRQVERYCREAPLGNPCRCMTMNVLAILRSDTGVSGCQFINQELAKKTATGIPVPCCKNCTSKNICGYCCDNAKHGSCGTDEHSPVAMSQRVPDEKEVNAAEIQQELPALKNNDQRKQWLREYKNWGLWYRDENIDVNYYKFDFPDGSRLVAAEYPQRLCCWKDERMDEHYFHLLEKNKMGYKTRYDEQYRQQTDSETYLVEFLKNIQKKGDRNE